MASSDQRAGRSFGRGRPSVLALVSLLLVPPISNLSIAQTTTSGGLAGVVTDTSGAVVPAVDVVIKDNAKGTTQSTKTDQQGVYRFFFLAPARYATGHRCFLQPNVSAKSAHARSLCADRPGESGFQVPHGAP